MLCACLCICPDKSRGHTNNSLKDTSSEVAPVTIQGQLDIRSLGQYLATELSDRLIVLLLSGKPWFFPTSSICFIYLFIWMPFSRLPCEVTS